jgi:hypothetical protein
VYGIIALMDSPTAKRYWLFAGGFHYPNGGMMDFLAQADTTEDLQLFVKGMEDVDGFEGWWHILDTQTMTIVNQMTWQDKGETVFHTGWDLGSPVDKRLADLLAK